MKRDVGELLLGEGTLVEVDTLLYTHVLLVEHEREKVISVLQAVASRFINE